MPFQISLVNSSRPLGVINSFTAGTNQYVTCASSVTLTATVDGNLGGHVIGWEQISGNTQIVWTTPTNQLSVTYAVVGGGSSDRIFRFYIDKGTPIQQYADITMWGTPTESDPIPTNQYNAPTSTDVSCRNLSCSSLQLTASYPLVPATYAGVVTVKPTQVYTFTWTGPTCDTQYLTSTEVIRNNNGILQSLGILPPGANSINITNTTDAYYFYVNYTIKGIDIRQFSCRYYHPEIQYPSSTYVDEMAAYPSTTNRSSAIYYSLTAQPSPDDGTILPTTVNKTAATYYALTVVQPAITTNDVLSSSINKTSVTYYSNNGIGG